MAEYHVGYGFAGIYAGTVNKDGTKWTNKNDVTEEALESVRDYMVGDLLGGFECTKAESSGYEWTLKDGRIVELRVTIKDNNKNI